MFILRRINTEGLECNMCLGEDYIVTRKAENKERFESLAKAWSCGTDEIYAFITSDNATKMQPLYKKSRYYIMTENGKTFSNISFR